MAMLQPRSFISSMNCDTRSYRSMPSDSRISDTTDREQLQVSKQVRITSIVSTERMSSMVRFNEKSKPLLRRRSKDFAIILLEISG